MGTLIAGGAAAAYGAHHLSHGGHHLSHGSHHLSHGHHHGKFKHGKFKHGKFGKHKKHGKHHGGKVPEVREMEVILLAKGLFGPTIKCNVSILSGASLSNENNLFRHGRCDIFGGSIDNGPIKTTFPFTLDHLVFL
ncbi:unnamed protein product [Camellia sinensis]